MDKYACSRCGVEKPNSEYTKRSDNARGLGYACGSCRVELNAKHRRSILGVTKRIYHDQIKSSKFRGHTLPDYSLNQFREWALSQKNFMDIYNQWVESGYEHLLAVSCDRLDDYKPYTLDNIRVTTWGENKRKGHDDRLNGKNRKQSIGVVHVSPDGTVIAEYHSISEASRNSDDSYSRILKHCREVVKNVNGNTWRFSTSITSRKEIKAAKRAGITI